MLKYRPEIDGLRALAVSLVLLYHAGISFSGQEVLPGGFLGVDIFFVISGYLITKIITREIAADAFSLWDFYERRARRIIPALSVVLCVTCYFCWQYLDREAFVEFGDSVVASVSFVANIFFYFQDSYNAEASGLKPLVHVWSLGVEEQFYIIYPLLLLVLAKTKGTGRVLVALFLLSLACCEWSSYANQKFNFYMLPTRAWELLAGGLTAKFECKLNRNPFSRPVTETILLISVSAILVSSLAFTDASRLPSLMILPLVLGTVCLLLFGSPQTYVGRVLSCRPVVFVGLVSYSLYLWHQPVLVLFRVVTNSALSNGQALLALALSFVLAAVSYYWVETPCRRKLALDGKFVLSGALATILLFSFFGWRVHANEGYPSRFMSIQDMLTDVDLLNKSKRKDGHKSFSESHGVQPVGQAVQRYVFNDKAGYTLITAGDSHMETLTTAIIEDSPGFIHEFIPSTFAGTLFLLDGLARADEIDEPGKISEMPERAKGTLEIIRKAENPMVIMGGRLPLQLSHSRFDNKEGGIEPGKDRPGLVLDAGDGYREATIPEVKSAYQATISTLLNMGCKVVLVYPIPEVGWDVVQTAIAKTRDLTPLEVDAFFSDQTNIATRYAVFKERTRSAYEVLNSVRNDKNLLRIYPEERFCDGEYCYTYDDALYYRDDDHLSHPGAVLLYQQILSEIEDKWGEG